MTEQELAKHFLESALFSFRYMKDRGDRTFEQLDVEDMQWSPGLETNSIAIMVRHLRGNMLSRWTDWLTTDGEKPWRDRDGEFEPPPRIQKEELLQQWEEGWGRLLEELENLETDQLLGTVMIRDRPHTVIEAIHRQLHHCAYHVGQIVQLGKMRKGAGWKTLSIARGQSRQYRPGEKY